MKKWFLALATVVTTFALEGVSFAATTKGGISDPAEGWRHLWHEVLIDITIIGIIFAVITFYLIVTNIRKSDDQMGTATPLSSSAALSWAFIPVFLFLADDFFLALKGWDLFRVYRTLPEEGLEIKLEASMWNFNFKYPNGIEVNNDLVVPKGTPVVFKMTSIDTIHAPYFIDHWVKEDVMPGRITHMWILPTKVGETVLTCAEYCGFGHSMMSGKLIIKDPADYDRWVADNAPEPETEPADQI